MMQETSLRPQKRKRKPVRLVLGTAFVAAVGSVAWQSIGPASSAGVSTAKSSTPAAVPVEVAEAARRDFPVYLTGLGTVQAFNTVTVKVRVDGELQKVAFTEGQDVKAGDLLAQIDPRPFQAQLEQVQAKKAQDEALLANAKRDLARFTKLDAQGFATKQSLDTQQATVAQEAAAIRGDQAAIDNAQTQLSYTTITAPISGRTGIRLVDQGNIVHATDTTGLVVITQLQPISVIFTVPEEDLPEISAAMEKGPVKVLAMSQDGTKQLDEGTVALIDNQIDQSTGTARLKATFPNRDHGLWPGQFINARLLLDTLRQVVTVPSTAVERGAQGLFVYVVKPDNAVEVRWPKVGRIDGGYAVIEGGLAEGEQVVTAGQYRLQPGTRVSIRAAQAQTPRGKTPQS